jgi:hypothetical protein
MYIYIILVRNQIQKYSKKISGQCNVTTRIEQVQDKKKTLTGQRRNTIKTSYVSILRLLVSDWQIFFKYSPLKLLSQMNQNLVRSNYGRFYIKIAHFIPISQRTQSKTIRTTHFIWLRRFRGED